MYNLAGAGKSLKLVGNEEVLEKAGLLQIGRRIDSISNGSPVFCFQKLIKIFFSSVTGVFVRPKLPSC